MSIDAKATILYGVCFKHGTPEFERLNSMDWTPIEELEKTSPVRFVTHGDLELPRAYVVGIPAVRAEVYSWQDPAQLIEPNRWGINGTLVLLALQSIGFTGVTRETAFGWYLAVHVG